MSASSHLRAVAYLRVSSEEQAIEGVSLAVQEADCLRAAALHKWEVADVLRDEGFSAFSRKPRPAFTELWQRLREWDVVMVWRLDRLSRRNRETLAVADDMMQAGIRLYSCREEIDTATPAGRLMLAMLAGMAQYEPEVIQERVRSSMERLVQTGRKLGFPPYGYTLPAPKATIVPDPQTAPIVRQVFEAYASGQSPVQIATALNEAGVPTVRGGPVWRDSQIRRMLARVTYLGRVEHTRTGTVLPGQHEAIVPLELWQRVQARRRSNATIAPRSRSAASLSPLLRCGECGSPLKVHRAQHRRAYICSANVLRGEGKHPSVVCDADLLEGYIWEFVGWLLSPETEALRQPSRRRRTGKQASRMAELEEQVRYAVEVGRLGGMTPAQVAEQTRPLLAEQERLQAELARRDLALLAPTPCRPGRAVLAELRASDYGRQRDYLRTVLAEVVLTGETIAFTLHGGEMFAIRRQRFRGRKPHDLRLEWVDVLSKP